VGGLWPIVVRSLRARPLRTALTAIAVALGVAAVLGVQLTLSGLDRQATQAQQNRAGRSDLDVRAVKGPGLNFAELDMVRGLQGVAEAQPFLEKPVNARSDPNAVNAPTVEVVGMVGGEVALRPLRVVAGRLPSDDSTFDIAIDEALTTILQSPGSSRPLRVGDDIRLTTETGPDRFHVVGIAAGTTGGLAFTRSSVYVTDRAARGPFQLGLRVPLVGVRVSSGFDVTTVAAEVHAALGADVITADPRAGSDEPLRDQRSMLMLLAALSVIIGAGVTANSVAVSAYERRREIGLLRAAGASNRQVFQLFLAEAAVPAVGGAVVGIGAGVVLGTVLINRFASSDLPTPSVSPGALQLVAAVLAGAGAAVIASLLPALAVRRVSPMVALRAVAVTGRERAPRVFGYAIPVLLGLFAVGALVNRTEWVVVGTAALLLAVALSLPLLGPLLLRGAGLLVSPLVYHAEVASANLARRRNRTAITAAGLVVSIASATAIAVLTSGAFNAGDRWINQLFAGDLIVTSAATQRDAIADAILHTDGVTSVTTVRYLAATVSSTPLSLAAIDPAAHAQSGALDIVKGDRATALTALSETPSVLVPEQMANAFNWTTSSKLSIVIGGGQPLPLSVAGIVAHSLPSGDNREALLMSRRQAVQLFGDSGTGFDVLEVSTDGNGGQTRAAATAATYGMRSTSVVAVRDAAHDSLSHSIALLLALAWLSVIVAMLAVVNTLVINVRQGNREMGLLRAVGLSRRSALRLVLTEAALLAVLGAAVGVATGCLVALPLLRVSASPGFDPPFVLPLLAVAVSVAVVMAGAVLAALIPGRRSTGSSIVGAIRYE
jgi:putative ABC transport system permease protein